MLGAALLLLAFLITPMLALLLRSLDHLSDLNAQNRAIIRSALILSLKTSSITMVIILITGTPLAYLMARHSFRGQSVIETIIDLPIILPPAVAGLALLMAFGRRGILGAHLNAWGYQIGFSTTAVVIAQIFVASPFFVRTASAAFADVARIQEEAAADLFAKPWAIMRTITLPLAAPGLFAGMVLAWARAIGEFGATIMFAGNLPGITQTLPLAIYGRYEAGDLYTALIMASILLLTSFIVLVSIRIVGGRLRHPTPR